MRYLLAYLALAGAVLSALALQIHYETGIEPCAINAQWNCGIVNHSDYSVLFHVPVAAIGIAGYLLLGGLALLRRRGLLLAASILGFGFALHLTRIEANILQVWCLDCVLSQGIIALITLLSLAWLVAQEAARQRARKPG